MQSRHSTRLWAAAVALTFPLALTTACSRNDLSTQGDSPSQAEHGTGATNQPSQDDARVSDEARNLAITLTGCVEQQPGAIVLTGLDTAGAGRATGAGGGSQGGQGSTGSAATSDGGAMTLPSDSPDSGNVYRLEAAGDEDLTQYVGQRVTVIGRLASNVPSEATTSPADNDRAAVPGTGPNFGERNKAGRAALGGDDGRNSRTAASQTGQQGHTAQRESGPQGGSTAPPRVNAIDTRQPRAPQALWVSSVRKVADTCGTGGA